MTKVFAIGTCRVYEPARMLQRMGFSITYSDHRVRTPNQVLQFARHLTGEDFFVESSVAYLSTAANEDVQRGRAPEVISRLEAARRDFKDADVVLVEISSFREFVYAGLYIDPMLKHVRPDLEVPKQVLTRHEAATAMRAIRATIAKPVLWTCHVRPIEPGEEFDAYRADRERIAETVEKIAVSHGDPFFDPNLVVEELGQGRALREGGTDLSHFTEEGCRVLADRYRALLWPERPKRGYGSVLSAYLWSSPR